MVITELTPFLTEMRGLLNEKPATYSAVLDLLKRYLENDEWCNNLPDTEYDRLMVFVTSTLKRIRSRIDEAEPPLYEIDGWAVWFDSDDWGAYIVSYPNGDFFGMYLTYDDAVSRANDKAAEYRQQQAASTPAAGESEGE